MTEEIESVERKMLSSKTDLKKGKGSSQNGAKAGPSEACCSTSIGGQPEDIEYEALYLSGNVNKALLNDLEQNAQHAALEDFEKSSKEKTKLVRKLLLNGRKINCQRSSSVTYTMFCPTVIALDDLWEMYQTGELRQLYEEAFVDDTKAKYGFTHLTLKVTIDEEKYRTCRLYLLEKGFISPSQGDQASDEDPRAILDVRVAFDEYTGGQHGGQIGNAGV